MDNFTILKSVITNPIYSVFYDIFVFNTNPVAFMENSLFSDILVSQNTNRSSFQPNIVYLSTKSHYRPNHHITIHKDTFNTYGLFHITLYFSNSVGYHTWHLYFKYDHLSGNIIEIPNDSYVVQSKIFNYDGNYLHCDKKNVKTISDIKNNHKTKIFRDSYDNLLYTVAEEMKACVNILFNNYQNIFRTMMTLEEIKLLENKLLLEKTKNLDLEEQLNKCQEKLSSVDKGLEDAGFEEEKEENPSPFKKRKMSYQELCKNIGIIKL